MPPSSPQSGFVRPHPLAIELIARLRAGPRAAICDFASGAGRNAAALEAAGHRVTRVDDARAAADPPVVGGSYDAIVSTHGFLHGFPDAIGRRVAAVVAALRSGGLFFATFAATGDPRYGTGERLGPQTFAALTGEEAGVPHTFYDAATLRALLAPRLTIERIEAARSAHGVHWTVVAVRAGAATAE